MGKNTNKSDNKVVVKSIFDRKAHKNFYFFHSIRNSVSIYFLLIAAILMFYLATKSSIEANGNNNPSYIWVFTLFAVLLVPVIMYVRITLTVNNSARQRGSKLEVIEVTKNMITRKIEQTSFLETFTWPMIIKIYEKNECYYFYTHQDSGFIIMKRDIQEGSVELLNKLIVNYMKPDKKGRLKFKRYKGKKND